MVWGPGEMTGYSKHLEVILLWMIFGFHCLGILCVQEEKKVKDQFTGIPAFKGKARKRECTQRILRRANQRVRRNLRAQ